MRPSPIRTRLSNPCIVRKYTAAAAAAGSDPDAQAPVYCEHGGVRISAAQSVATKVPSIRELILQLNRRQQIEPGKLTAPAGKRVSLLLPSKTSEPAKELPGMTPVSEGKVNRESCSSPLPGRTSLPKGKLRHPSIPLAPPLAPPSPPSTRMLRTFRFWPVNTEEDRNCAPSPLPRERTIMEKSPETLNYGSYGMSEGILVCSSVRHPRHDDSVNRPPLSNVSIKRTSDNVPQFPMSQPISVKSVARIVPTKVPYLYPDPMEGATASFHQRMLDISLQESETIRWEKARALKRKTRNYLR